MISVMVLERVTTMAKRRERVVNQMCEWFAGCTRDANGRTFHPVLGWVPTCDKCHKFATEDKRDDDPTKERRPL